MIRLLCSILLIIFHLTVWANDTIPEIEAKNFTESKVDFFVQSKGLEKLQADAFRKSQELTIKEQDEKIQRMRRKIHAFFEVEQKEQKLWKLRYAKNMQRVLQLKLRKELLLTIFWVVLIVTAIVMLVFLHYRKEQKMRAIQFNRLVFIAGEDEKLRFSRELHDDFQATLSIIHMMAAYEFRRLPENENYGELKNRSNTAISEIRKISDELYPSEIKTVGLIVSLQSLVKRTNALQTKAEFHVHVDEMDCSSDLRIIWFRIVQKLINNTLKNSSAQEVEMKLSAKAKGFELVYTELKVDQSASQRELELDVVRELVHSLGGKFSFKSQTIDAYAFVVFFEEEQDLSIGNTFK
jgi:signal transduction histidine kinase